MILDHKKYIEKEQANWNNLDSLCKRIEEDTFVELSSTELQQFYILYRRTVSALAYLKGAFAAQSLIETLEELVGRAYAIIYSEKRISTRLNWYSWFFKMFPKVFRKHFISFALSCATMLIGTLFGVFVINNNPGLKTEILPFGHGDMDPVKRVEAEETSKGSNIKGHSGTFSAYLMHNNITVSVRAIAFGITFGIGTLILLFYNGIIMGGICVDYIAAGKGVFLAGWILPHGSIEIPSILIAGQAGFVIAKTIISFRKETFHQKLRSVGPDIAILTGGLAVMLIWAGIIEAFFSQYHEPIIPYWLKITFGIIEVIALSAFLIYGGRDGKSIRE
jgi:uncharacterized membrane protein SpoIIM required for sporulation